MKRFGVLLVSTGSLSTSFVTLIRRLMGRQTSVRSLALRPTDPWEVAQRKLETAVSRLEKGAGVLVLTDLKGSTPFNVAQSFSGKARVEVIGGMNVPMVLKAVQVADEMELHQAASFLERYGRDHIARGARGK